MTENDRFNRAVAEVARIERAHEIESLRELRVEVNEALSSLHKANALITKHIQKHEDK